MFSIYSIFYFHSCYPSPFITPSPQLYQLDFPLYHPQQDLFVNFSNCLSILSSLECDHVSNAHNRCPMYPIFMILSQVYHIPIPSRFFSSIFPSQAPIPILTLSYLSTFPSFHLSLLLILLISTLPLSCLLTFSNFHLSLLSVLPLFSLQSSLIDLSLLCSLSRCL